jgi:5-methyltetrahydrofolate--homocysteine methyltransferase
MELLKKISESLRNGDDAHVAELTKQAIDADLAPKTILDDGLIAGMTIIGKKFRDHEIFLPEVLLAARAMYAGMDLLKPLLIKGGVKNIGTVVIGSVQGDLHDIGKNLVSIMLRGAGLEVVDLGNDVPPHKFVETAQKESANVIGMSALLTTTMPVMKQVVDLMKEKGMAGSVKTIIGGAPVSADFAREIGADYYGFDAANAVELVKQVVGS